MMKDLAGLKLIGWERINGQFSNWLDSPFHVDVLLEKISQKIFLGLNNNKAQIQTSKTSVKLRELPQELVCWFAILQLQSMEFPCPWSETAGYRAKWPNEIDLDVVVYRQGRKHFVIQLLLLNNKNCLKLLKSSFWKSEREWMKQEYDPVLNQWVQ